MCWFNHDEELIDKTIFKGEAELAMEHHMELSITGGDPRAAKVVHIFKCKNCGRVRTASHSQ